MNVVLEGPDNAGKTTLAGKLRLLAPNSTYYHPGGKPRDVADERAYMSAQLTMLSHQDCVIADRLTCISQQVYNGDAGMDIERQYQLDAIKRLTDTVIIYCRPPSEVLMDVGNFTWRPEETEEHRQKIITRQHEWIERYDHIMQSVPCLTYNWKDQVHAQLLETKIAQGLRSDLYALAWFQEVLSCGGAR